MCGIVGILPREPTDPDRLETLVRAMAGAIRHRGPDEEGFHVTPHVALGARRLSIIDVARGHQPMFTRDRSKVIVYNGETYNHDALRDELVSKGEVFESTADTEVALKAFDRWGEEGLARLEGMFAFAVWDESTQTLTLARDRMGQKSVYFADTEVGWVFGSEIKALLALDCVPRRVDFQTLSHYMSMRYLPDADTLFEGIGKLPPAHRVTASAQKRSLHRYWKPSYGPKWTDSEPDVLDELDRLLGAAVSDHLMSEVPLGAFLSGGIDSSLVVAYAAGASADPLRTFSVGVDDASQSELPWARMVAEQYRTRHFETISEPDLARLAPTMVAALEEPADPFGAGVHLVSKVASDHVTVVLGGDGGDELFSGYDRYLGQTVAETYARIPAFLRRGILRPLYRLVPESFGYKSFATKLRWLDRMADRQGMERYAESAAFLRFPHTMKAELFSPEVWADVGRTNSEGLLAEYFTDGCAEAFVDRMLHADCMTRLPGHLLPIVDRMSMAHSLEVRSPFLDRRVVEFAMRIPAPWKMKSRRLKYVPRRLGERYLSRKLLYRKKQGFGFPLARWFRGELRGLMQRTVSESRLVEAGVFQREAMERILNEHLEGSVDHNYRLWLLFTLELWHRHFIGSESVAELEEWVDRARTNR